jgi:protein-tyrosine kinase
MGRIFDAIQRSAGEKDVRAPVTSNLAMDLEMIESVNAETMLDDVRSLAVSMAPERRLVALTGQRSMGAEKIRILATKVRHIQDQRLIKRLLITSSVKDEGKTVLAANLAISFARMKQRVLLIDGDCHQATAGHLLGTNGAAGLTGWYRADAPIEEFLTRVEGLSLWFLPSGTPIDQPAEMLQSQRWADVLMKLAASFDWVVIDSPPCAPLVDSAVWAKLAEGILLVTRDGKTPKRLLKKVVASLDHTKLLGIVLNDCSDPDQQYYTHYYNIPQKS